MSTDDRKRVLRDEEIRENETELDELRTKYLELRDLAYSAVHSFDTDTALSAIEHFLEANP